MVTWSTNIPTTYSGRHAPRVGAQENEFQFAGQQVDGSTGLQYLRARYYDMETGGFASRDPLSDNAAQRSNGFTYANGNPANVVDPLGLCGWKDPWNCGDEAASAVVVGAKALKNSAVDMESTVKHPLTGDAFDNLLTGIQLLDTLPLGAACVGLTAVNPGVGAGCFAVDKSIGIAAVFAGAIQAGLNSCSPGRNGAYFGLLLVNGAVDLVNPSGAGGRLIKEGIESVIDASTLTAQTAVTGTCSATMAHAPGRTIGEKGQ